MKMKFRKSKIILSATVILILIGLLTFKKYSAYAQNVSIPKNPKIISQSITNEKATLIWEKPDKYDNIKNYNIYQDGQKIGDANSGSTIAKEYFDRFYNDASNSNAVKISVHNYTVKNLKPNTEYHFTIRSIDNEGKESQDSQTVNLKTDDTLKIFNIEDFGAKGDGTTINTKEIQKAINECSKDGEVLIPKGKVFKTGSISLKSEMTLKVEGTLLGSENADDYPYGDSSKVTKASSLINTKSGSKNIRIVGLGVIDGNGWKENKEEKDPNGFFLSKESSLKTVTQNGILAAAQYKKAIEKYGFSPKDSYSTRSNLLDMGAVTNLYIGDGLTLRNPSQHTESNSSSNNVVLNGVKLETFNCNNGDGTGLGGGRGLIVVDSVLDTGDDDIVFNAGKGEKDSKNNPTGDIWIFDNYFGRGHGAVVCGSYTAAWIENILAEDNILNGTGTGLRCKSSQGTGGGARNITFRDTAMKNLTDLGGQPFIFTSQYNGDSPSDPVSASPIFHDITIENCSVDGASGNAILIEGLKDGCHNNIKFNNITFKGTKPAILDYAENCTFKDVKFDDSIINPWEITNSTGLKFEGTTKVNK
ncbi:exo-poly-alpha-D-galacturonosidase [Clostridium gelidum]|uniref:Exo-poly-alpha-D-galacturonosidase n=1 Tax=Clostridium gelidum TaxID=704125 RepID=A0ABM7TA63_9CLOT|nr:glycosyl hydrolase family 28 protein [Clostridium gelidum]BCZ45850.1 exo-poly-alpha-D-galacturonosidase [Clostridium gelidum]